MHKKVIIKAFEKAEKENPGRSNKTNISENISEILLNEFQYQISGRTLRNLYDQSKEAENNIDINLTSSHIQYLCKYLGYNDYNTFMIENPIQSNQKKKEALFNFFKRHKITFIISLLSIIITLTITKINGQKWMIWQQDHYEEVSFDEEKFSISQLKIFKEEKIENFKKINPDCQTSYFNEDGTVNIYYGKNANGDIEFFTDLGQHPETGKTLKEITLYIIKKYVCVNYASN